MDKLRDPKARTAFILQLKNRFQKLVDAENHTEPDMTGINTMWEQVKTAYTQTGKNLLGKLTEEEEGVDHNRYLACHREQENPEEESHADQFGKAEREIQAAVQGS